MGRVLAIARLSVAGGHARAIVMLLDGDADGPAVDALARAWEEAAARTFWLVDPAREARELVRRGLVELLEERRQLSNLAKASGRPLADDFPDEDTVLNFAEQIGLEVTRDSTTIGKGRPSTLDLLTSLSEDEPQEVAELIPRRYRRQSAAVHAGTLAWASMLRGTSEEDELARLRHLATELSVGLRLHMRAFEAWNDGLDWSPPDMFKTAVRAAAARFTAAYMDLVRTG